MKLKTFGLLMMTSALCSPLMAQSDAADELLNDDTETETEVLPTPVEAASEDAPLESEIMAGKRAPKPVADDKATEAAPINPDFGPQRLSREGKTSEWMAILSYRVYGSEDSHGQLNLFDKGIHYARFITPNFKYGIDAALTSYTYGVKTDLFIGQNDEPHSVISHKVGSGYSIRPHLQYLFADSFSVKAFYRIGQGTLSEKKFTLSGYDLALGNQWNFDSITVSFDYLTYGKNSSWKFDNEDALKGAKKGPITSLGMGMNFGIGKVF
ncbi:MAG: hypothetical protein EOP06_05260 [Proteobacteria bacterium]|nr:MAG: hypothetical protein EOP06_05260 [Pseudomonadota bacterium]